MLQDDRDELWNYNYRSITIATMARVTSLMEPTPTDADLAELADLVLTVARDLQGRRTTDVAPLTPTETTVIRHLHRHPGASPSSVAEGTGLHRSNLSTTLRQLEAKGLVERTHDEHDRRTVVLRPTARAVQDIARLRAHWAQRLHAALDGDTTGLGTAKALLERVEQGLAPRG